MRGGSFKKKHAFMIYVRIQNYNNPKKTLTCTLQDYQEHPKVILQQFPQKMYPTFSPPNTFSSVSPSILDQSMMN